MTWRANSGAGHRDNGAPLSTAGRQASAFTCATCTGVNVGGWPDRFPSTKLGSPGAARHLAAVSTQIDKRAVLGRPRAASSTMDIRNASRCVVVLARATNRESSAPRVGINSI